MDHSTPEREALHDSAMRFLAQPGDFSRHHQRLAQADAPFDRALWARVADMGWLGIAVPEALGGLGQTLAGALTVAEAMGQHFMTEPYAEALAAAQLLQALGSAEQQARWLPPVCEGRELMLLAHAEPGARYDLACVNTRATRTSDGWRLDGHKCGVPFGDAADRLLVSACTDGEPGSEAGISLFVVERGTPGLRFEHHRGIADEALANVNLDGVTLPPQALLGPQGGAFEALAAAHDWLLAAACAEAVGTLEAVHQATCEYARTRRQFGSPLSGFQVIAHRLVDMFTQLHLARSMAELAGSLLDAPASPQRRLRLSACKAQVSEACRFVGEQAIQIHGGIGMTDELHVSHRVRRLLAIDRRLGDRFHHLGQLAKAVAAGGGLYA